MNGQSIFTYYLIPKYMKLWFSKNDNCQEWQYSVKAVNQEKMKKALLWCNWKSWVKIMIICSLFVCVILEVPQDPNAFR